MPVSPQFRDFVLDQLGPIDGLDTRRMFGGLSLRRDGQHFAMMINDTLYLTCDDPLRAELLAAGGAIFSYAKRDRVVEAPRLVSVPEDILEEPDLLLPLAHASIEVARGTA